MSEYLINSDAVFLNGNIPDVRMNQICSCSSGSLEECENECGRYYSCDNVLEANMMLARLEEIKK